MDHKKYMAIALIEAEAAFKKDEVPVGAIVVCNDRIIAKSHNLVETLNDPTAHAEMQAITSATNYIGGKYLHDCTIYITLEPCVMCAGALFWSQISNIVYGAKDEKRGFTAKGTDLIHPKTKVIGGVLDQECANILTRFFQSLR